MTNVRTQYREAYAPRTISKAFLRALVEALVDFKPGLPTRSRKIRAKAISAGKITELEGPESWKVTDPHSLAELDHVRVELLLTSAEHRSCELHVEFRSGHITLGVSDNETGWGISYLYACLALFIAGVMPAMTRSFHFFSPPKRAPIIQETVAKSRNFPWAEATAVLSFLAGVLQLAKALIAIVW